MMKRRLIAIGDVHGCIQELKILLKRLKVHPNDRLIFLGDLVNKGPDSKGVLDLVRGLSNAIFLFGNHEVRLLKYHATGDQTVLKSIDYPTLLQLKKVHWHFLETQLIPYYYEPQYDTVFVHGGFLPGIPWREQSLRTITRIQVVDKAGCARTEKKCPKGTRWDKLWKGPP